MKTFHSLSLLAAANLALAPVLFGQATATTTSSAAAEEPISLSPFQVNAADDTGYRATNTLDGSRLNTPLRDTPGAQRFHPGFPR